MQRVAKSLICILLICFLCSCSFVGDADFMIFQDRFNENNKTFKIEESTITSETKDNYTKYNCFLDTKTEGKYLMTVNERTNNKIVTSCTLCILSSFELNIENVQNIFCSMLFAYNQTDPEKALEMFKKLGLNETETYQTSGSTTQKFDDIKIKVIVNGAGTSITIYKS